MERRSEEKGIVRRPTTVDAIAAYLNPKNVELFEKHEVFTGKELASRYEIMIDRYVKTLDIEARTML